MARTDDPQHADLLRRVNEELRGHGFLLPEVEFNYHSVLGQGSPLTAHLRKDHSFPALMVRTRKDMIACHPEKRITIEYDAKTNQSRDDFFVELFPVAMAILASRMGGETLFCVETVSGNSYGVWANDGLNALVDKVFIPDRWAPQAAWTLRQRLRVSNLFPCERLVGCRSPEVSETASGDPSVRIPAAVCQQHFPTWQQAIKDRLAAGPSIGLLTADEWNEVYGDD